MAAPPHTRQEIALSAFRAATGFVVSYGMLVETLGDRITIALRHSGMTDAEAAKAANLEMGGDEHTRLFRASWLSAAKTNRIANPPVDKLAALARVCGVSLRYLAEPLGWYADDPRGDSGAVVREAIMTGIEDDEERRAALITMRLYFDRAPRRTNDERPERRAPPARLVNNGNGLAAAAAKS